MRAGQFCSDDVSITESGLIVISPNSPHLPAKRLASFYFFWFAALGVLIPYWGLYMQDRGYRPAQIGAIFALLMATKMVAPNVWGWVVDHYGGRMWIIRGTTGLAALMFLCIPFVDGFVLMALFMVGYGFFSNASLPQFEAVTFDHLGDQESGYGRIRLWGSVGFILAVLALGPLLEHVGTGLVPWWIVTCLVGLFAVSLCVPTPFKQPESAPGEGFFKVLLRPEVVCLLVVCFLAQLSHGPYYTFFSIYMEQSGYTRSVIGMLWALGVLAEIAVFAFLPSLILRIGLRRLMLTALAVTSIRWVLLAFFPENLPLVIFAQLMHLASFGIYHAVAVNLIHRIFRGRLQGRGQALYSSLSFGAGGALGSLGSGYLWETTTPQVIFLCAASAAALGWVIAWFGLRGNIVR